MVHQHVHHRHLVFGFPASQVLPKSNTDECEAKCSIKMVPQDGDKGMVHHGSLSFMMFYSGSWWFIYIGSCWLIKGTNFVTFPNLHWVEIPLVTFGPEVLCIKVANRKGLSGEKPAPMRIYGLLVDFSWLVGVMVFVFSWIRIGSEWFALSVHTTYPQRAFRVNL